MEYNSCIKVPGSKMNSKMVTTTQDIEENSLLHAKLKDIAALVFGEKNWSHSITSQTVDYSDFINGKHIIGCNASVKVDLKDGVFHEEAFYCLAESSEKGLAIKKARDIAITNALMKSLQSFGDEIKTEIKKMTSNKLPSIKPNKIDITKNLNGPATDDTYVKSPVARSTPNPNAKSPILASHLAKFNVDKVMEQELFSTLEIVNEEPQVASIAPDSSSKSVASTSKHPKAPTVEAKFVATTETIPCKRTAIGSENLTEEDIMRQERKKRQKEKQEQYRKIYIEKQRMSKQG